MTRNWTTPTTGVTLSGRSGETKRHDSSYTLSFRGSIVHLCHPPCFNFFSHNKHDIQVRMLGQLMYLVLGSYVTPLVVPCLCFRKCVTLNVKWSNLTKEYYPIISYFNQSILTIFFLVKKDYSSVTFNYSISHLQITVRNRRIWPKFRG